MAASHVLVVDDIKDARVLMRLMLSTKGGFVVSEASSGREALTAIKENRPDAIVLDYMMPDLDGAEVCRIIRATPEIADVPILVLTARVDPGIQEKVLAAGANSFLPKPVKPDDLVNEVMRLIAQTQHTHSEG
ncbi:MAG: hypothetical protein Kow0077_14980 [Anaerolineae bacterium]